MFGLPALLLATLLLAAPSLASDEAVQDPVGFGAGQSIPATLTLNYSKDGRDARLTPARNNYRPRVLFGGTEVICMMRMERGASVAPGESGDVRLECVDPVAVARASTRHIVRESGKDVGFVDIQLPSLP